MWLTKLEFGDKIYSEFEFKSLECFLNRNLPLHRAPVIERFRLTLGSSVLRPENIRMWAVVAVSRHIRELKISASSRMWDKLTILPSTLYTCKSLVILKLFGGILLDVPRMVSLPSLKILELISSSYSKEGCLQRLLSNCPVLEYLVVHLTSHDNVGKLTVIVPSLQHLSLFISSNCHLDGFVMDAPSLETFIFVDFNYDSHPCLIENMPKLTLAYIDVKSTDLKSLIGSITSVKYLTISSKATFGDGFIFKHLERLTLYVSEEYPSNLLVMFLKDSPNLQGVNYISEMDKHKSLGLFSWHQPSTVPKCLLSSLQNFTWSGYLGRPQDRDIAEYILQNACRLRTANFMAADIRWTSKLVMVTDLTRSPRASPTCELLFR